MDTFYCFSSRILYYEYREFLTYVGQMRLDPILTRHHIHYSAIAIARKYT